jgi:hypothetical protein
VLGDSSVVVTGACYKRLELAPGNVLESKATRVLLDAEQFRNIFLVRYDASGSILSKRVLGGEGGRSVGRALCATADGGFLLAASVDQPISLQLGREPEDVLDELWPVAQRVKAGFVEAKLFEQYRAYGYVGSEGLCR